MDTLTQQSGSDVRGQLSPRGRKTLLAAHLLSAVGLAGVALVEISLGVAGLRGAEPETVYPAMAQIAWTALVPLALLALGTGVAQALLTGFGLFRQWWVTVKLGVTALLAVVALAVAAPGLGRAADAATAVGQGVTQAQQVVATVTPSLALLLLILNAVLGLFQPGPRTASAVR